MENIVNATTYATGQKNLRKMLEAIMDPADARACDITRSWNQEGIYGWQYRQFGQGPWIFLGKSLSAARGSIHRQAMERAEVAKSF